MAEVILTPISPSVEKSSMWHLTPISAPRAQERLSSDLGARMPGSSCQTLFTLVLTARRS